ncbi:MAG: hypothetical protein DRN21_01100 [Thermoplasmata archaeon]|nr:MAG: hypothetical protein DRN21_01100 [Thermoplasmata archaeon]
MNGTCSISRDISSQNVTKRVKEGCMWQHKHVHLFLWEKIPTPIFIKYRKNEQQHRILISKALLAYTKPTKACHLLSFRMKKHACGNTNTPAHPYGKSPSFLFIRTDKSHLHTYCHLKNAERCVQTSTSKKKCIHSVENGTDAI